MDEIVFLEAARGITIERLIRKDEYSMPSRHIHRTYEVYCLLEGERYFFIGKEAYHVRAGTVVLIGRDQIHKTSIVQSAYHDRILMQIDGDWLDAYLRKQDLPGIEEYFSYMGGMLTPSGEVWDILLTIFLNLKRELKGKKKGYELIVQQKLAEMLIVLYRVKQELDTVVVRTWGAVEDHKYKKVEEIAEYLTTHCETEESLEQLARRFYISKSYLTRIFKEVTGLTIREYINACRVKRAKHYLWNSDCSITEIAERIGFDSITYFERIFKRYADVSPLRYRKMKTQQE